MHMFIGALAVAGHSMFITVLLHVRCAIDMELRRLNGKDNRVQFASCKFWVLTARHTC